MNKLPPQSEPDSHLKRMLLIWKPVLHVGLALLIVGSLLIMFLWDIKVFVPITIGLLLIFIPGTIISMASGEHEHTLQKTRSAKEEHTALQQTIFKYR